MTLPGNLAPGTYYVGGISDYTNQLSESNETNNTYNVVQVTVTAPPQPDLSEYLAVNKTTVVAGTSLTVDAYNMNLGNAAAGPATAGIYLSTDATITTSDTLLTTISTSTTLATVSQPGYYDHQTVMVTLPGNLTPGTYYVGGIADYNNHLAESNETNNTYNGVRVTVAAGSSPAAQASAGAQLFGHPNIQDNFALSQVNAGDEVRTDHAQLAELVSASTTQTQQLAATLDAAAAHFAFDNLPDVSQNHLSDYHLL
ncbi:hypothetical protein JQ608_46290 [Bradyrhizobium liaoningense]|uniref:CARDB domain-containing protein n=1 Tax=Bradyrhizobium liaoningense TaxID=43992 RepID=UPI001BA6A183|nr:CARDB domain-containing protein [Bradyrhizobium liaoningense]MBR0884277.1 hypothetical protein [Bradyrhizobium liaoningense]